MACVCTRADGYLPSVSPIVPERQEVWPVPELEHRNFPEPQVPVFCRHGFSFRINLDGLAPRECGPFDSIASLAKVGFPGDGTTRFEDLSSCVIKLVGTSSPRYCERRARAP
jgi:hypothetical protein